MTHQSIRIPGFVPSLALALVAILITSGCSGTQQLANTAPENPIYIDGDADEWYEVMTKVDNDRLQVAVSSDDDFLHMVVRTSNRALAQMIIGNGLDVLFESEQEGFESWSMRYPVGVRQAMMARGARPGLNQGEDPATAQSRLLEAASRTVQIMYGPEQPIQMEIGTMGRFEAAATYEWEVFTAEWRIPLSARNDSEVALADVSVADLSIRLTTPEASGPGAEGGRGSEGGPPSGGVQGGRGGARGGTQGGARGGARGGQGGPGGQARIPLDVTLEVVLGGK